MPAIANYYSLTLDDLLGMQDLRSEKKRREIFTAVLDLERQENWDAAIRVLRDAAGIYPNDDGLLTELALVLSKIGDARSTDEAIALSEKVLARCTNEKIRSTARANLCFLYKAAGLPEKAVGAGRTLPHIWECREMLLPDLVSSEQRADVICRSLNIALQVLTDVASEKPISFSLGYRQEANVDVSALLALLKSRAEKHST